MSKIEKTCAEWLGVAFVLALLYWHMKQKVTLLGIQGMNAGGVYDPTIINPPVSGPGLSLATWTDNAPQELQGKGVGEGQVSNSPLPADTRGYDHDPSNRGFPASGYVASRRGAVPASNPLSLAQEAYQIYLQQEAMERGE